MKAKRLNRVAELLKEEISDIILKEMSDPRTEFVSITRVKVSPDLRHADVFFSVFGSKLDSEDDESNPDATLDALSKASGYIRGMLGKKIRIRYIPQLRFHYDPGIKEGQKILQIIENLNIEGDGDDDSPE